MAQTDGQPNTPQSADWLSSHSASPGRIALLWLALFLVVMLDVLFFQDEAYGAFTSRLFLTGTPVFSALLAGWVLQARSAAWSLASALLSLSLALAAVQLLTRFAGFGANPGITYALLAFALVVLAVWIWTGFPARTPINRVTAILLVAVTSLVAVSLSSMDERFSYLAYQARSQLGLGEPARAAGTEGLYRPVEIDALLEAQPALIASETGSWADGTPDGGRVFVLSIAASGGQDLFSREAKTAIEVMESRFGAQAGASSLLSNGQVDLFERPLATRSNIAALTARMSDEIEPEDDIAVIYLTSHGGPDAELQSILPDFSPVRRVTAEFLADTLAETRIRRRVIIVSACFAGSWIPALANDDTIVIAAAAGDRTSFGCDDSRELTYFGEGFLGGPLAEGASFAEAFAAAKARIAEWEAAEGYPPSLPEAFIGLNMAQVWQASGSAPDAR